MNKLTGWMRSYGLAVAVGAAILSALLLPLNLLTLQPFHHDEALYATWALKITSGDDPWLNDTPIDKPPLFLYTVAGAMRLLGVTESAARTPSLLANGMIVLLTFWLGRKLYGNATGILAAWLVALSPFMLMFAPTAFTDPLLVALLLAACVAAVSGRAGWAGLWMGLAIATKQQGLFFVPLTVGLLMTAGGRQPRISNKNGVLQRVLHINSRSHLVTYGTSFVIALIFTLLPALLWDFFRHQPSGFLMQSLTNYGGLTVDIYGFGRRWQGFIELLEYATASTVLNIVFLLGTPLLLGVGVWQTIRWKRTTTENSATYDWVLATFALAFLLLHAIFSFQVWDRYLLGILPLPALLLARVLLLPWRTLQYVRPDIQQHLPTINMLMTAGVALLLALTLARPVQDAANARYPLGSDSHALRGIEQITGYLQGHVGANNTLYHHWLGTHWRFYLWKYPYDLQFWESPEALAARAKPGHLIAFPTSRSNTETRIALYHAGFEMEELVRAYAPNGTPSIILYRINAIKK